MSRVMNHLQPTPAITPFAKTVVGTPVKLDVLFDILQHQRFAGTAGEQAIIDKYLKTIPGMEEDDYGNLILTIPTRDGQPSSTLFSCHTDTVEKKTAVGTKRLAISKAVMLKTAGGGVLGADDGTGMWLMLNLIEAKVPGTYIFHREEECGGGGSSHIARYHPQWLGDHKRAIAFDRKGTSNVITHQGGRRCCSDAFAQALADQLNAQNQGFTFAQDDGGTFTDTANYVDLIPECTNLAVGYYGQHTQEECQDLSFCTRLANALIAVDWENLPTQRDPAEREAPNDYYDYYDYWADRYSRYEIGAEQREVEDMIDLVFDNPEVVAYLLIDLGYDSYELERAIEALRRGGR